jgi:hypothetical protein
VKISIRSIFSRDLQSRNGEIFVAQQDRDFNLEKIGRIEKAFGRRINVPSRSRAIIDTSMNRY